MTTTENGAVPELTETPDAFLLRLEVPGVEEERIELWLDGQLLFVGERRSAGPRPQVSVLMALAIPEDGDGEHISACFRRGHLLITVPKRPQLLVDRARDGAEAAESSEELVLRTSVRG